MADDLKSLEIQIRTTTDLSGAQKTAGAIDALTNSGKGLATNLPDLAAKTEHYTIKTEAEYVAAQKLIKNANELLTAKKLLGIQDDALVAKIATLDAALSTESALNIAETIEKKAAAAATLEHAGAVQVDTIAMRESVVIARELMTGRTSRIPGSLSILLGQFNLMKYVFSAAGAAIGGVALGAYAVYEHLKKVNKELDDLNDLNQKIASIADDWQSKVKESFQKSTIAAFDFRMEMDHIGDDLDPIKTKTDDYIDSLNREAEAAGKVAEAHKGLIEAKIDNAVATGKITPEQAVIIKLDLDETEFEAKLKAEEEKAKRILEETRQENVVQQANAPKLEANYDAANAKAAQAEAAHVELEEKIKTNQKRLDAENAAVKKLEPQFDATQKYLEQQYQDYLGIMKSSGQSPKYKNTEEYTAAFGTGDLSIVEKTARDSYLSHQRSSQKIQSQIQTQKSDLPAITEAADKAKEEAKIAGDVWEDCLKDIVDSARKLKTQVADFGLEQKTDATVIQDFRQKTDLEKATALLKGDEQTGPHGEKIPGSYGHIVSAGDDDLIQSHVADQSKNNDAAVNNLRALLSASGFKDAAVVNILNQLLQHTLSQAQIVAAIQRQMSQLSARTQTHLNQ